MKKMRESVVGEDILGREMGAKRRNMYLLTYPARGTTSPLFLMMLDYF